MRDALAALQDAHNRRLALEVAIFLHPLVCFLILLPRLLELDSVDLDAKAGFVEVRVDAERVGG